MTLSLTLAAGAAFCYLLLLFAIAFWGDRRAAQNRSLIDRSWVYALSIGVYCTAWTFFGSVGRAAEAGVWFLPIYLGPTLVMLLAVPLLLRLVRVAKAMHITSISDFIATRYGRSERLGRWVSAALAVVIVPYVALQIKAVALAISVLTGSTGGEAIPTFGIVVVLAVFAALFGTRRLEVTERHEGLVAAIAFESFIKLAAFLLLGAVTLAVVAGDPSTWTAFQRQLQALPTLAQSGGHGDWLALILVSALAFLLLPRQFQVMVVENIRPEHVRQASWQFPLYLLLINLFVLPIAALGQVLLPAASPPDTFVLAVPLALGEPWLALVVFLGGISAATSMVIVESVAIATMISNDWVAPWLLRRRRRVAAPLLLWVRRATIALVLFAGYGFYLAAGGSYALVAIGLLSFLGVAQLAPALLGGVYWRGGSAAGAAAGLLAGVMVWAYTALVPVLVKSGWWEARLLTEGPWGIAWLRPEALFGVEGMSPVTASFVWSLLANGLCYVWVSRWRPPDVATQTMAQRFVSRVPAAAVTEGAAKRWQAKVSAESVLEVLQRFLPPQRLQEALAEHRRARGLASEAPLIVDDAFVALAERLLAGAIGGAAARLVLEGVLGERAPGWDEVMALVDEARAVREANERLRELDQLKDEFISSVSHELRTPITAIRALAEILASDPDIERAQRAQFYTTIVRESERLSRLVNQVLDLAKLESGTAKWQHERVDLREVISEVVATIGPMAKDKGVKVQTRLPVAPLCVWADRDRLVQVLLNLVSNALKFVPNERGIIEIRVDFAPPFWRVAVSDNGPGVPPAERERIFERFHQTGQGAAKPMSTGLGLAIARRIVEHLGGRIWVEDASTGGACFVFTLPRCDAQDEGEDDEPQSAGGG